VEVYVSVLPKLQNLSLYKIHFAKLSQKVVIAFLHYLYLYRLT